MTLCVFPSSEKRAFGMFLKQRNDKCLSFLTCSLPDLIMADYIIKISHCTSSTYTFVMCQLRKRNPKTQLQKKDDGQVLCVLYLLFMFWC